jgi:predicted nucleic acid-binding protein
VLRAVIDTNVVFEGMTDADSDSGLIVEAWIGGLFTPCLSDAVAYEYVDVLSRRLSNRRRLEARPVLARLVAQAAFTPIHFRWRPSARDPGDDHVVDCAMNANACVVTRNTRDFAPAVEELGVVVFTPEDFVELLALSLSEDEE